MGALGPVSLEGVHVRLEPLRPHHAPALAAAAESAAIWPWLSADLRDAAQLARFIADAQAAESAGAEYAFAVVERATGLACGSTRYLDVQHAHRAVEIGWTWYARPAWSTAVNPEAKLLLLRHAFEDWRAIRVQLKTDHLNLRSQAALRKLGAVYEGTLRHHRIRRDGTLRNTVVFSILEAEWPAVRAGLLDRLAGRGAGGPGTAGAREGCALTPPPASPPPRR